MYSTPGVRFTLAPVGYELLHGFRGNTAQRKATGEKGPATEPEPRIYTLLQSYVLVVGVYIRRWGMKDSRLGLMARVAEAP